MKKHSKKIKDRDMALAQKKAVRRRRAGWLFVQVIAFIGVIASVIAAIQPLSDLTTNPPTAQIVAPRSAGSAIQPQKMILLDSHLDQRFFYFVDKRKININQPFLIGFPFSISNSGDKRLDRVTITLTFEHATEGLLGERPSLSDRGWPVFADIPWQVVDITGRNDVHRKFTMSPKVASVTFSGFELLPKNEHFFEFHFTPKPLPVSVIEGGAQLPMAIYDVKATVVADSLTQIQRFRIIVLPSDDDEDFTVGVDAFSHFFGCKRLCRATWLVKQIHKVPWLAKMFTQEYENVLIKPTPLYAEAPNGIFRVLKPEEDIRVKRFVQTFGKTQPQSTIATP